MAFVVEIPNPFNSTEIIKHEHPGGISIRDWLKETFPGFVEFDRPTICIVNGQPVKREGWDSLIKADDIIAFVGVAGEVTTIVAIIIAVVAIILAFVVPLPNTPGALPASDPVFSVKGRNNSIRLGEPIEVAYGKNRIYPSYASRPYYQYENNDQFQFSLFCLGQGEYAIESVQISDTAITEYQEASYEIVPPGSQTTLFPINVYTSPEAGGQALRAPNEDTYVAPGWVGPFPANPSSTQTNKIQIDLVFPKGLYAVDKKGRLETVGLTVEVEARLINDAGTPIGSYFSLFSPIVVTGATTTPQRRTYSADVTLGRYEVRLRRTSDLYGGSNVGHDVEWEGMRGYLNTIPDFGDVTLLAVKIRATSNLNEQTNATVNVICTRKLPVYESAGFTDPQETRSIVWAFVDIFRSLYGARITDTMFFDFDALTALDATFAARGDYFDYVFRDPITVWEAARTVARVGRAVPLLVGSLITIKRDEPLEIPVAMFTQDNIVKGSFEWNVLLWEPYDHDSVSVTYIEPSTGYKEEQIIATLPGGTSDSPEEITIPGIGNRAQAYREAMYIAAGKQYLRENITFDTGMEGHIPTFGDLIAIAHDTPQWGQAGLIVHAEEESGGVFRLWLSEPVVWSESESSQHVIMLRGRPTTLIGPFSVTPTSDPKQILITIDASSSGAVDFLLGRTTEPMLYLFGISGSITKYAKVVKVEPQSGEVVRITAVNDEPIIHSFDELEVPALTTPTVTLTPPDLPEITSLTLTQLDVSLHIIQASWSAAYGAQYYVIQTSQDGVNYQSRGTTTRTSIQLQVFPGELWVKVAAVNVGQGPWIEETLVVGLIAGLENYVPWDALEWSIRWNIANNETGYRVDVYDNSSSSPVLKRTTALVVDTREFNYTYAMALSDGNVVRDMLVQVTPLFVDDPDTSEAAPASLDLSNSVPAAPTSPASAFDSATLTDRNYELSWTVPHEDDLVRIKVWLSPTTGFDPNVETPDVDETISSIGWAGIPTSTILPVPLDSFGEHPAYYWRVAIFDVWGNEITTNITTEQVIAAYP